MNQSLHEYALHIFCAFLIGFILYHNQALAGEAMSAFAAYPELIADRAAVVSELQVTFTLFIAVALFIGLLAWPLAHGDKVARAAAEEAGPHDPVQVLVCGAFMLFWIIGFAAIATSL